MGLAHMILREQLYDEAFIQNSTFGFEDWQGPDGQSHVGFKRLALEEYAPGFKDSILEVLAISPLG